MTSMEKRNAERAAGNRPVPSKEKTSSLSRTDANKGQANFFALLIGINIYNGHSSTTTSTRGPGLTTLSPSDSLPSVPAFLDLLGAVPDAKAFEKYLLDKLKVDQSHIKMLLDQEATRDNIIDAFQKLATNDVIKEGDSIFIYYAGHGAQASPPKRLDTLPGCPEYVEVLIPYDYGKDAAAHEYMGIPDYTLAALLDKIATKKGNNITVVFDCCHSGSALRGGSVLHDPETITRAGPELQYAIPDDLDEAIWGGTRSMTTYLKLKNTGTSSYVFFSACKSNELAKETSRRGCFTRALLAHLEDLGSGVISEKCSEVIKRLQEKIDGQSPQCEGLNSGKRPIFQSYKSPYTKAYFNLAMTEKGLTLKGGSAHGFCKGDQLAVYKGRSGQDQASPAATVEIIEVFLKSSTLKLVSSSTPSIKDYSKAAAFLIKTARFYLKVYVAQNALALLSIDNSNEKKLRFDVKDRDLLTKGLRLKPRFIDNTDDDLRHVLKGVSHYYHHLKRTSDRLNDSIDKIPISFYEVQETGHGHPRVIKKDGAENLCTNNVIDITVPPGKPDQQDKIYGLEVTNNTDGGILYPVLFYFDNIDFTITQSYPHTVQGENAENAWPVKGKSMTIGYGIGPGSTVNPFTFYVSEQYDVEAGFFKLFLFEKSVDLQNIVQEQLVFDRNRGMVQLSPAQGVSTDRWGSITVTVIQRRGR